MSELNREQIMKAMECCYNNNLSCLDCPFQETDKYIECSSLTISALALIKELTEENERLKSVEFTCGFVKPHKVLECPIFDEIANAKANTLREVQEKFALRYGTYTDKDFTKIVDVFMLLEQIEKEMMENIDERYS